MKSVDTNILLHALDRGAAGHNRAYEIYRRMLDESGEWVLSDQTLFELFRALRNPKVLERPLSAVAALEQLDFLRNRTRVRHVAYRLRDFEEVTRLLGSLPERKGLLVFDAILAVTLRAHGVKTLYTRNTRDFGDIGFFDVIDPLA